MQVILAAIAGGASLLGLVYAHLAGGAPRLPHASLRPLLIFIAAMVILFFLLTIPAMPPFAPGMSLGWGLLIGGAVGIYALLLSGREEHDGLLVGLIALAGLGPAAILLAFRGYPNDVLLGYALGAVLAGVSAGAVLRPLCAVNDDKNSPPPIHRGAEVYVLLTVAVVAATLLAIERFPRPEPGAVAGGYWAFPALVLAAGGLVIMLVAREWRTSPWRGLLQGLAGALAVLIVTFALQLHLLTELAWELPLYGMLAFAFPLAVLLREANDTADDATYRPVTLAFGIALLAMALMAVAFRRLHGYGEMLALLPTLLLAAGVYLAPQRPRTAIASSVGMGGAAVLLLLLLYRLFLESVGRGFNLDFQHHYNMFALILGAVTLFGLLAFAVRGIELARRHADAPKRQMGGLLRRTVLLGFFAMAVPAVLLLVWGSKTTAAFITGLVIAEVVWMMLAAWMVDGERTQALTAAPYLPFVGAALAAIVLGPPLTALELSIPVRLIIVSGLTLAALLWVVTDALLHRRENGTVDRGGGPCAC